MNLCLGIYLFVYVVSLRAIVDVKQDVLTTLSQEKNVVSGPCDKAKEGAGKAADFARESVFAEAKRNVQLLAVDGKEHGIAFGKDGKGQIVTSPVSTGNVNRSRLGNVSNKFADLHNHPGNFPPSSGDVYALIDNASLNHNFETRYVVTAGGTVYGLIITDLQQASEFNTKYPRVAEQGYQPRFPEMIVEKIIDMKGGHHISEEMAMAYVLKHYHMGVALLKQDSNGRFIVLNMDMSENADGTATYYANNCR